MSTQPLRELLEGAFPDATELDVVDRTGGGDHFQVVVASASLDGLSLVEQHRPRVRGACGTAGRRNHPRAENQDEGIDVTYSEKIKDVIDSADVALFMKGTPQFVMCGNSDRALQALRRAGAPVTTVDVLADPQIRQDLSEISGWPTIPQVFVKGELVGGADIVEELESSGELEQTLRSALARTIASSSEDRRSHWADIRPPIGGSEPPEPPKAGMMAQPPRRFRARRREGCFGPFLKTGSSSRSPRFRCRW